MEKDTNGQDKKWPMENENAKPLPKTLPGYVCQQWKRCGKRNCRCAGGQLHGPYFYRFGWKNGRQFKEYVRLADVSEIRQACLDYRNQRAELRRERQHFRGLLAALRQFEHEVLTAIQR